MCRCGRAGRWLSCRKSEWGCGCIAAVIQNTHGRESTSFFHSFSPCLAPAQSFWIGRERVKLIFFFLF
ncbi:hypothetical protein EFV80_04035 [Yersinia enterocolitica]|nr:hypothetical protein [Yersinia enterocolitica]EKN6163352.1 hypothetical protein [Yersinia enterocolitica]